MFIPKYRMLITSEQFSDDGVVCLGHQFISIVNSIKKWLPPHFWCGADVEALGKGRIKYCLKDIQLKYIGSDAEFIDYCSEIAQFIWGVFVCLDQNFLSQDIQGIELETEDRPFRRIEAQGILIELRTFDTTYFCLYTDDLELAKKISDFYQITLECVSGVC